MDIYAAISYKNITKINIIKRNATTFLQHAKKFKYTLKQTGNLSPLGDEELDFPIESVFGKIGRTAMYVKLIFRINRSISGIYVLSRSKQKKQSKLKKK